MNPARLMETFKRICEAPDAVPRLRRFVLNLAVRGKLVEQEPGDEPASELFKRIRAEKVRLVKERKLKQTAIGSAGSDFETPFSLPSSWTWGCLGDVAQYGLPEKVDSNNSIAVDSWVLDLEDIEKHTSRLIERIRSSTRLFRSTKNVFKRGDVLFGKLRPYLNKVLVADEDGVCTTEIIPIRGFCGLVPEYVKLVLKSPLTMTRVDRLMYGMKMPRLGTGDAIALSFPLPPLAEQHRVVAKVDELMALCDQLEAAQTERESRRDRVATASLNRLISGTGVESCREQGRFYTRHLPHLTTRLEQIQKLREIILNLAVRGKLVPQDPSAESASGLLKRILTEKARMMNEGTIKKTKESLPIDPNDFPSQLPDSWIWARTETLCEVIVDCPHSTPAFAGNGVPCIDTNAFKAGAFVPHRMRYVSEETYRQRVERLIPRAGDIVFAREGSVGASVIIPHGMKCCLGQRVMLFRPMRGVLSAYFSLSLSEPSSLARLLVLHKGIGAKHVNVADMRSALIPLPPVAEQERIVAKVDELMSLCNQLEAQVRIGQAIQRHFADAVLHAAVEYSAATRIERKSGNT